MRCFTLNLTVIYTISIVHKVHIDKGLKFRIKFGMQPSEERGGPVSYLRHPRTRGKWSNKAKFWGRPLFMAAHKGVGSLSIFCGSVTKALLQNAKALLLSFLRHIHRSSWMSQVLPLAPKGDVVHSQVLGHKIKKSISCLETLAVQFPMSGLLH